MRFVLRDLMILCALRDLPWQTLERYVVARARYILNTI
jgi:hypothetical protein